RDHARMNTKFEALFHPRGDAEMLDAIAEFGRHLHVLGLDPADALGVDAAELQRNAKGDGGENGQLVGGVDALDVERRVGLGIAEALRLGERIVEALLLCAHGRQYEIPGAVDDACDAPDAVAAQALADHLDDADAAGDGGLERHHHAALLGALEDLVAVHGDQRLVGGDHVLAALDGGEHEIVGGALDAADQLDDDIYLGVVEKLARVGREAHPLQRAAAHALRIAHQCAAHVDGAPRPTRDLVAVALEHVDRAAANGADAGDADLDRFHRTPGKAVARIACAPAHGDRPAPAVRNARRRAPTPIADGKRSILSKIPFEFRVPAPLTGLIGPPPGACYTGIPLYLTDII